MTDNLVKEEPVNKKEDLRPIGTEFTYSYPPDLHSSEWPTFYDWTYRVTAHVLVRNEYHTLLWGEAIEPVCVRRVPAVMKIVDGRLLYERGA